MNLDQSKLLTAAFHRICQREECVRIWKQLARELSLLNDEIQTIDHQYATRQERCLRALQKWSQNEPLADILCLAKILRTLGFKTLARMFRIFDRSTFFSSWKLYFCLYFHFHR